MNIKHQTATGKTTITLDWTETRQVMSGAGLNQIRDAIQAVVKQRKTCSCGMAWSDEPGHDQHQEKPS